MSKQKRNNMRIVILVITGAIVFSVLLYFVITRANRESFNESITLPVTGISMPYWLLVGIDFIICPAFAMAAINELLNKLTDKLHQR